MRPTCPRCLRHQLASVHEDPPDGRWAAWCWVGDEDGPDCRRARDRLLDTLLPAIRAWREVPADERAEVLRELEDCAALSAPGTASADVALLALLRAVDSETETGGV